MFDFLSLMKLISFGLAVTVLVRTRMRCWNIKDSQSVNMEYFAGPGITDDKYLSRVCCISLQTNPHSDTFSVAHSYSPSGSVLNIK